MNLKDLSFTKDWTLFLDRDGVISRRVMDGYVQRWDDFRFLEGVLEAMPVLAGIFGHIIIVSNQQGVGKGMMSARDLDAIDLEMRAAIQKTGGRIDASYYCTKLASENHPDRKPGTGMALKAKAEFPDIDFLKSVMVGDSPSDMEFGKKLGMVTVFISDQFMPDEKADFHFSSLYDLSCSITTNNQ
jgi:histidinol-phosphate phosphatase family protein